MKLQNLLTIGLLLNVAVHAQNITFDSSEKISANGVALNHPFGTPTVADWNGDGVQDVLIGEMVRAGPYNYLSGKLAYYQNEGTNASPDLTGPEYIQVNGQDILLEAG